MNKQIMTVVLVAVVVGGIGFYGGTKYAGGSQSPRNITNMNGQRMGNLQQGGPNGMMGGQRGMMDGGIALGEVVSKDATSITIKLQDGGSKIILISESTPVMKSVTGSASDITVGEQITVTGSTNSDGSISANSIRVGEIRVGETNLPR